MARYKDDLVIETITPYLQEGESLLNYAYGVKQPPIALIFVLMLLAIVPGVIAVILMTKEYVVALTDRRFIVLRVKGAKATVNEMTEYSRSQMPKVKAETGSIFTHLRIDDPQKPFIAKFHRMGMSENRRHSQEIAAALT